MSNRIDHALFLPDRANGAAAFTDVIQHGTGTAGNSRRDAQLMESGVLTRLRRLFPEERQIDQASCGSDCIGVSDVVFAIGWSMAGIAFVK